MNSLIQSPQTDWQDATVSFGKNKGIRLADLEPKQLHWYQTVWQPRAEHGRISEADLIFRAALDCSMGIEPDSARAASPLPRVRVVPAPREAADELTQEEAWKAGCAERGEFPANEYDQRTLEDYEYFNQDAWMEYGSDGPRAGNGDAARKKAEDKKEKDPVIKVLEDQTRAINRPAYLDE